MTTPAGCNIPVKYKKRRGGCLSIMWLCVDRRGTEAVKLPKTNRAGNSLVKN